MNTPSTNACLPNEVSIPANYSGRCFMYVAVCSGPEDMIKVGLSLDPIAR